MDPQYPLITNLQNLSQNLQTAATTTITSSNDSSILLFLIITFSFLFLFKHFLGSKIKGSDKNLNLPPSPPRLPILGNLHLLGKLPHRSIYELAKKHGPVMMIHMGHKPVLVVSSAEMAREVTKTQDIVFANRSKSTAVRILLNDRLDVAFAPYGEYWRQARKICVMELLSHARVQSFQCVRQQEVDLMIKKLRNISIKGDAVNLSEMVITMTNNIMARCVLGQKCEGFGELSRRIGVQFEHFSFGDWYPSLGWLDVVLGLTGQLKKTYREMDAFFSMAIEEHKIKAENEEHKDRDKEDFVDILLRVQRQGALDFNLSIGDIKALLADMIVAGTDTTSATTEWTMAELIKNPKAMEKAQEEVRDVVGNNPEIKLSDINQMHYLKCVIKESLRLHGPAFLVPRETATSTKLGGYDIPAKTRVFVQSWAIHRDPTKWDRPEEFIPERFETRQLEFVDQNYEFMPFGAGRRCCPGMSFGIATVEFFVASLLYHFDWRLPGGATYRDLDMTEDFALAVPKKTPLCLVPVPSRHLSHSSATRVG